ncbi:hypothetical protein BSL78_00646 [Apostichopus japonicus]|uniref:Uncharacterized protein n=1 Tax=Stichopus japonicus TaxID=307972 RepID=A0A2G8LQA1_STIJA|nr:hypothetical protein BSL78_00646 [Apostichopus japonicus]
MESSSSDGMMTSTVSVHEPTSDVTTDLHMEASSSEVVTSSTATHGGTNESAFTYSHPNNDVTTDSPTTETLSSEGIVTFTISFEGSSASTATRKLDDNDVTTAPPMESSSSDGMMTSTVSVHEPQVTSQKRALLRQYVMGVGCHLSPAHTCIFQRSYHRPKQAQDVLQMEAILCM